MTALNARELDMMDSPLRRFSQRTVELRIFQCLLERANIDLRDANLLDAGCGNGYGLELISRTFRPRRLVGFDLMPEQVDRANARARRGGIDAQIGVADITRIPEPDDSFDGVFVFGILHHVPRWRAALVEIARVLRPGGVLLVEEIHGTAVRLEDRFLGTSHPVEAAFPWPAFRAGLEDAGLEIAAEVGLVFNAVRAFAAVKAVRS